MRKILFALMLASTISMPAAAQRGGFSGARTPVRVAPPAYRPRVAPPKAHPKVYGNVTYGRRTYTPVYDQTSQALMLYYVVFANGRDTRQRINCRYPRTLEERRTCEHMRKHVR